ncbi:hypothetical protein AB0P32_00895 [Streptomyces sp. NPDC085995]|uniref:hypothetical protein n=1 Tax=Streptomyces sp. NPDC085995 TaxID=3154861 RepID=UPI0034182EA6
MTAATTAWGPRPPKSALHLWSRYCFQWLWEPPVWLLARLPLLLLTVLEVEVPQSGRGRMREPRWRRRIWIDRERPRLERNADPQAQERELRQLLSDHSLTRVPTRPGAAPPLPCPGGRHRLDIDDSPYRPLGARRAVGIAHSEYGRVLADNTERSLPGRLRLRCPDAWVRR